MSNFPLYDSLSKDILNKDLSIKQKNDFINNVKNIDNTGSELIYALIKVYHIQNIDEKNTIILPFEGEYLNNEIKFDLDKLPNKLKQILFKFLQIHTKTMKEDIVINENRGEIINTSS